MEEHIDNTGKIPNRCIGINDKGKLCRTRTRVGSYFCCDAHRPKNLNNLVDFITGNDMSDPDNYEYVKSVYNTGSLIDYFILNYLR